MNPETLGAQLPALDTRAPGPTRDALHAYARVLGAWLKAGRSRRKHWWHASLRPSLHGLSTGVIYGDENFSLDLDLAHSRLHIHTATSGTKSEDLAGQSPAELADTIAQVLLAAGVDRHMVPATHFDEDLTFGAYSPDQARQIWRVISFVSGALEEFRSGVREEASPIQLWPHHFDLAMLWLPGPKVPGQDPANEEYADKQMNFGFVFGDAGIPEPYFYITAYPMPETLRAIDLPGPACWQQEGFSGVVLSYAALNAQADPRAYLLDLWKTLLTAGQAQLVSGK